MADMSLAWDIVIVFVCRKIRKAIDNNKACLACKRNTIYAACVY